jgi:20S proteasome alpha/beta subunit
MTVCAAVLFRWNYGTRAEPNYGPAAVTMSDRKITAGDVEYEPNQRKIAQLAPRAILMVAGDLAFHSEAILLAHKQIKGVATTAPENIALIYGQAVQAIKRRRAEDLYLAPVGLNTDSFLAQQRDLSPGFVDQLTHQMQRYREDDVEALLVASDGELLHLYSIDEHGTISCLNDVGFGAIGIGAWHTKSRLMQWGFVNTVNLAPALAACYAAKKAAEVAPGVGTTTDITIVYKDRIEQLVPAVAAQLPTVYESYKKGRTELEVKIVNEIQEFLDNLK